MVYVEVGMSKDTMEELLRWERKMRLNSIYGSIGVKEEANDQVTIAIRNSWANWSEIKHTVADFAFNDWVKREGGFEFKRHYSGYKAIVTEVHDEQKYAWFLLRWA
jgi:hypothetical protein